MSLIDKSKANKRLAYELYNNEEYDAAANRFYYSCYQMLYQLAVDKMQYVEDKNKSTHKSLIEHVDQTINLLMLDQKKSLKLMRTRNITGVYNRLKTYRVNADYKEVNISETDMEDIKNKIKDFEKSFSIIKNTI
ncbi:hypothetical protein [Mammaliicoccus sciuri]|uniref:hypothetical protein n=1 Tax=Mammaliicoccus sciuri TaxID=1296 RepID=UPI001AEBE9C1